MRVNPLESFILWLVLAATLLYLAAPALARIHLGQPQALTASTGQVSDLRSSLSGYHGSSEPTPVFARDDRAVVSQRSTWAQAAAARQQVCAALRSNGRHCRR